MGSNVSFDTTITVDDNEIEVTVEGTYSPGFAGSFYRSNGDPGDPPEDPEFEATSITDENGKEYEYDNLSESDRERLDERICELGEENLEYSECDEPEYHDD